MSTATRTFERKGVWHSELVRVTDPDGLSITLKGKPRESKDGDSFYVYFTHEDDDHYYTIENEDIKAYLDSCPVDVPVTIHAFGSREAATITVEDADGALVIAGQPMGKRPQDGPPQLYPDDELPDSDRHESPKSTTGSGNGDLYLKCLLAARASHAAFTKQTGTPVSDDDIRIATTMFINASR